MFLLYDLIFLAFAIFYFPYLLIKGKWHKDFGARFGIFSKEARASLSQSTNIWIHAVSVGEVLAITKLVTLLKSVFPPFRIVITTVTQTGFQLARKTFPQDTILYAPLDLSFTVGKYIDTISPKIYIAAETEIWPNLFLALRKRKIPIVQVNGRLSDKAFGRYKLIAWLSKPVLNYADAFCMQSEFDAQKIKMLGAHPQNVFVVGNMKFDDVRPGKNLSKSDLGLPEDDLVLIAGSTHPGEEEILLEATRALAKEFPQLKLVLAPRHIERTQEIVKLVEKNGFKPILFSTFQQNRWNQGQVLIVDTIGHLKSLYNLATVVFVGKSLTARGGHNIIEPALFAKPIIIGPDTDNFKDTVSIFLKEKAVMQIKGKDDLLPALRNLLYNPKESEDLARAAKGVIEKHTGATAKTMEIITKFMVNF